MKYFTLSRKASFLSALILALALFGSAAQAQTTESTVSMKARAKVLMDELKYIQALPIYEQLATLIPSDNEVQTYLGTALLAKAASVEDVAAKRQLRVRAREAFISAKKLGNDSLFVQGMIDGLPAAVSDDSIDAT